MLTGVDGLAAGVDQGLWTQLLPDFAQPRAQSVDAMAVIYTTMMLVLLVVALRFVNPTQLVARVEEETE